MIPKKAIKGEQKKQKKKDMSYKITNNNSTMADNCIKNYIKYKYRKDSKKMEIEKTVDWE